MMLGLPEPTRTIGSCHLYLGDCSGLLPLMQWSPNLAVLTDPPYGIRYESGKTGHDGGTALDGILGDEDVSLRDGVVRWLGGRSAIMFGSWKRPRPDGCKAVLIWEKGDHVGMGDLSMPWKPNTEEIYILGSGFAGHRGSSVLKFNAPVSWNSVGFGRTHPHEKPIGLMVELVAKTVAETILDPFMGSGTTGVACIQTERKFIGIEREAKYFEIAVDRIQRAYDLKCSELPFEKPAKLVQRELLGAT